MSCTECGGKYLGGFDRCQTCLAEHWYAESRLDVWLDCPDKRGERMFGAVRLGVASLTVHGPTRETAIAALRAAEERAEREAEKAPNVHQNLRCIMMPVPTAKPDVPRYADGSEVRVGDTVRLPRADSARSMLWVVVEMSDSPRCFCLEESGRGRIDPWRATPIRDPAELAATLRPKDRIVRDGCVPFVFGRDGADWADRIRDGWRIVRRETLRGES